MVVVALGEPGTPVVSIGAAGDDSAAGTRRGRRISWAELADTRLKNNTDINPATASPRPWRFAK
jgi:hypothetical protein